MDLQEAEHKVVGLTELVNSKFHWMWEWNFWFFFKYENVFNGRVTAIIWRNMLHLETQLTQNVQMLRKPKNNIHIWVCGSHSGEY